MAGTNCTYKAPHTCCDFHLRWPSAMILYAIPSAVYTSQLLSQLLSAKWAEQTLIFSWHETPNIYYWLIGTFRLGPIVGIGHCLKATIPVVGDDLWQSGGSQWHTYMLRLSPPPPFWRWRWSSTTIPACMVRGLRCHSTHPEFLPSD